MSQRLIHRSAWKEYSPKPIVSYQPIGGERVPVKSRYELEGDSGYGFWVGAYEPRYPLIIDPGLDYSTYQRVRLLRPSTFLAPS